MVACEAETGRGPVKCWTGRHMGVPLGCHLSHRQARAAVTDVPLLVALVWPESFLSPQSCPLPPPASTSIGVEQMNLGVFLCFCFTVVCFVLLLRLYHNALLFLTLESMT